MNDIDQAIAKFVAQKQAAHADATYSYETGVRYARVLWTRGADCAVAYFVDLTTGKVHPPLTHHKPCTWNVCGNVFA